LLADHQADGCGPLVVPQVENRCITPVTST